MKLETGIHRIQNPKFRSIVMNWNQFGTLTETGLKFDVMKWEWQFQIFRYEWKEFLFGIGRRVPGWAFLRMEEESWRSVRISTFHWLVGGLYSFRMK